MYKFRTMSAGSDAHGAITGGRDARVFPVGRFLRRFKLDELPQLINVVLGDMALVGPRPEDPGIVQRHYKPWMMESLDVTPGVTSPGSLNYFAEEQALPDDADEAERVYAKIALPQKIAHDLVYVRNRSFVYDVDLLFRTGLSVVGLRRVCENKQRWEHVESTCILNRLPQEDKP